MYRPIQGKKLYYLIALLFSCLSASVLASIPNKAFAYTEVTNCVNGSPVNPQPSVHPKATINVNITAPTGMNSQLELVLKDSSSDVVGKAKTCGNLNAREGHTVSLKTSFFDIDQGSYTICLENICRNTAVKKSGSLYVNPTVNIILDSSQVVDKFAAVTISVRMKVETPTSVTTYGPIPTVLINAEGDMSKIAYTGSEKFDAKAKMSQINLAAIYSPAKDGVVYRGCIPDSNGSLWKCSGYSMKKANQNLKLYIDLNESESKKFISNTDQSNKTTCAVDGIGWIVCPVVNFMAKVTDGAYSLIGNLLITSPLKNDSDDGTYLAWGYMRSLANVAFVIAFLVIVFSQLTGAGITNYGVKKILPRLVVAAILVNLSYFICTIAVDLSNIIGSSLGSFLGNISGGISLPTFESSTGSGWAGVAGVILSGAVVTGISYAVGLSALIPALIAALVAVVTVFLTLTIRQALIIILVVISPLAFVAYLLPNTENLFKKWQKLFVVLLTMYPVISLVFAGSALASKVIMSSTSNMAVQIMGALAAVLPLFMIPTLMKSGGNLLGNISNKIKTGGGVIGGAAGKKALSSYENSALGQYSKYRATESAKRRALIQSGSYSGRGGRFNPRNWGSSINKTINQNTGKFGERRTGVGETMVAQAEAEDLKNAQITLQKEIATQKAEIAAGGGHPNGLDGFLEDRALSANNSPAERSAAMHALASTGRDGSLRRLAKASAAPEHQAALQAALSANAGSLANKAPDLIKGDKAAFGNVTGNDLVGFSSGTAEAYMKYLSSLQLAGPSPEYTTAKNSFNSAVNDIALSSTLQGSFGSDVGEKITTTLGSLSNPNLATDLSAGIGHIQPDGKIR